MDGMEKRMKKFIFSLISLISISGGIYAQNISWPDSLDTAKEARYLTENEKAIIREMNMVRTNPKQYAEYIREEIKLYEGKILTRNGERIMTEEGVPAIKECIRYLEKAKPVGILQPDENLYKSTRDHTRDQSKTGRTGHYGKDKSNPLKRITRYHTGDYSAISENIAYGQPDARNIVIQLLIDDGVKDRGHRKAIMDAEYNACGVSIAKHPKYRHMCVINYIAY